MIKYCKYNLIALIDVDDIWLPQKLEKQIPLLDNYDVIGTKCQYFGNLNFIPNLPVCDLSKHNFLEGNPIINSSAMLHKSDAYWEENEILEDYDLWIKLYFKSKKFYNIPEVLCKHRIHNASAFNTTNSNYVEELINKWKKIKNII